MVCESRHAGHDSHAARRKKCLYKLQCIIFCVLGTSDNQFVRSYALFPLFLGLFKNPGMIWQCRTQPRSSDIGTLTPLLNFTSIPHTQMAATSLKVTEGYADFVVPAANKPCRTWYKIFGDLEHRTRRPLLVLHGGPGMVHNYLLGYRDLSSTYSIPVVLYDQLGNGQSTHLPEKAGDATFWTEQLFVDELNNLLTHIGIQNDYDLLGHSWGGIPAALHAVQQPKGLHHLIIYSSPASVALWNEAQGDLREKLSQDIRDTLSKHETGGTTHSQEYKNALGDFHSRHVCKMNPMPQDLLDAFMSLERDSTVRSTMYVPCFIKPNVTLSTTIGTVRRSFVLWER